MFLDRIYRLVQLCILPIVGSLFLAEIAQLRVNFLVAIVRDDLHLVDIAAGWACVGRQGALTAEMLTFRRLSLVTLKLHIHCSLTVHYMLLLIRVYFVLFSIFRRHSCCIVRRLINLHHSIMV